MKLKTMILASLLAAPVMLSAQVEPVEKPINIDDEMNEAVMTVNGEVMTVGQLIAYSMTRQGGMPLPEDPLQAQDLLVNELLSTMLLSQEAVKMGIEKKSHVAAALTVARQQTLRQAALDELINRQEITDEAIQAAYDAQHGATELVEYKTRHIIVNTEEEAAAIIKDLDNGADFAELATKNSIGPSSRDGGDLGWINTGTVVKPFGDALTTMESGKYSASPVQTDFGWHVILLEEQRSSPVVPPSLESVREELSEELRIDAVRNYLEELQNSAELVLPEGATRTPPK